MVNQNKVSVVSLGIYMIICLSCLVLVMAQSAPFSGWLLPAYAAIPISAILAGFVIGRNAKSEE